MSGEAPLLIRADASVAMGTGHAMRCLSLAQAWQDSGGQCLFAMAEETSAIRQRIEAEGCEVAVLQAEPGSEADSGQFSELAHERKAGRVVVDGYRFGDAYQRSLKSAGLKVLFVDDYGHAEHYSADLVLNQNVSADERKYANRECYTRLLLGTRYALLRREFDAWRDYVRKIPVKAHRVLITLGGSDPQNLTARALEAVASIEQENLAAMVVVGGSNPRFESLQRTGLELAHRRGMKITVQKDVPNMAELMSSADVAIAAAGSTCWELCLLALPALLVDVAENQTAVARELHRRGCAIHLGSAPEASAERWSVELEKVLRSKDLRQTLSARSRGLVDGNGARRVVSEVRGDTSLQLRRAQENDARLLFEWVNDPEVRSASFSSGPIPWESHVTWFSQKLQAAGCCLWIAEDGQGTPLGQIRFDLREDGDSEVDVSIVSGERGRGLAQTVIKLGVETFLKEHRCPLVHAFVKTANAASARAFEKAGFTRTGMIQVRGNMAIHFAYEKK